MRGAQVTRCASTEASQQLEYHPVLLGVYNFVQYLVGATAPLIIGRGA